MNQINQIAERHPTKSTPGLADCGGSLVLRGAGPLYVLVERILCRISVVVTFSAQPVEPSSLHRNRTTNYSARQAQSASHSILQFPSTHLSYRLDDLDYRTD